MINGILTIAEIEMYKRRLLPIFRQFDLTQSTFVSNLVMNDMDFLRRIS